MGRLVKNIGLALLFLVTVLILVNIFFIMPLMRMDPVQTDSIPAEVSFETTEREDAIVAVDSLSLMRENVRDEPSIYIDPGDKSIRNPFFWPGKKLPRKTIGKQTAKQPQLSMVIIGERRRQALLDNVFVLEGERYHGYLVKRIEENQVVLADDLGEMHIYLKTGSSKNGGLPPPSGLIER